MAAGEHAGADGRAWIAAAAVAYEVQCRLCDAASIRARGWDHVDLRLLSSALAASKLLGLDHARTVHALGIAGTTGTALRLTRAGELSMWKGCAFAHAARNGVFAALAGPGGHDRPGPAVRGGHGLLPAGLRARSTSPSSAARRPATGCCRRRRSSSSRPSITASRPSPPRSSCGPRSATRRGSGRSRSPPSARPSRSSARTPRSGGPRTRETADHSLPYCTAVALVDGEVTAAQFTPERLTDPALLDLVSRTTVVEDPDADRRLSRRHPQPGHGDARRRHDPRRAKSPSRPATTRTR